MTHLEHYLHAWELSEPQTMAQTPSSHVYRVTHQGARVVLKLLTELGAEERTGAVALRCYQGRGAVRLLNADDHAHLLEYAGDEDAVGLVKKGQDDAATVVLADVLNVLHSATPQTGLVSLRRWFRALSAERGEMFARARAIADDLLAHPLDEVVLHGDMHHENVRLNPARGWVAFDPKGLIGERTFDAANVLRNPMQMHGLVHSEARLLRQAGILAEKLRVERSRLLAYTYAFACLSACWILDDGDDPNIEDDLTIAQLIEPHL